MNGPGALLLSILMIAAFLLAAGGVYLVASRRDGKKGALMLICSIVLFGNVLVWAV